MNDKQSKAFAEKLNGRFAMLGIIAGVRCLPNNRSNYSRFCIMNNQDIFEKAVGRPAMFAFVLFGGIYLATGQLIPGIV